MAVLLCLAAAAPTAAEQLGALVSPGRLAKPHAELEGILSCTKCHEAGERVTAARCLSCHAPIAERIKAKRGVHRSVQGDCVTCHAEHQGTAGELRPFDTSGFDHARETGYPLDGKHAPLAAKCESCHKTRSFLAASTACASCHTDTHKGTLGNRCETCHTTQTDFKDVRQGFDHSKAAFPLDGAHLKVACDSCHRNQQYKGLAFATCDSCHRDPHTPKQAESCTTCHTAASWRSRRFDHARTDFVLKGQHQTTACVACHVKPALQATPRHDTCAACHQDPHRGRFKDDCGSCHNEQSFAKAPFDHATTAFPLTGKHAPAACVACHTNLTRVATRTGRAASAAEVDFGGLKRECASCHDDTHKGDLGATCESCHTTDRFAVPTYAHRTPAPFFEGAHTPVTCVQCHASTGVAAAPVLTRATAPPGPSARATTLPGATTTAATRTPGPLAAVHFTATPRTCVTCHADVHLGQVAQTCESCHSVSLAKFAVAPTFDHGRTRFPLGGKHAPVACAKCH
ncbi:MAG: cytochrome c3 family protein [Vicinamibacterales bacterium]